MVGDVGQGVRVGVGARCSCSCCGAGDAERPPRVAELPRLQLLLAPLVSRALSRSAASTRRRSRRQGAQTPSALAYGWSLHLIARPGLTGLASPVRRRGGADRERGRRSCW